ncbi:hypothetical protein EV2_018881 [Malus domestica]
MWRQRADFIQDQVSPSLHNQPTQQKESELNPRAREVSTSIWTAPSSKSIASLCNAVKSPPLLRKQEYFISCFLHILFFVLVLTCGTRRKKAIRQHLVSIFRSGTNCLEPFPDCLPSTALEVPIVSTSYASRENTTSA